MIKTHSRWWQPPVFIYVVGIAGSKRMDPFGAECTVYLCPAEAAKAAEGTLCSVEPYRTPNHDEARRIVWRNTMARARHECSLEGRRCSYLPTVSAATLCREAC